VGRAGGTYGRGEKIVRNVLVGKPEGKRPLGRLRRSREVGNRMDFREIALGVWIGFDFSIAFFICNGIIGFILFVNNFLYSTA
jgi:hypothetical protein